MRLLRLATWLMALAAAPGAALADYELERTFDLGSGGELVLDTARGAVVVEGTSSSGVRVVVTSRKSNLEDYMRIDFDEEPGRLTITGEKTGRSALSWLWGDGLRLEYEIEVPAATRVNVVTRGGSIRIQDVQGMVEARTSGGAIVLESIDGDAEISTSGGSIDVERVRGTLRAKTSGGSIQVADIDGDLRVGTSGGSITIDDAGGRVEAHTSGGRVRATLRAGNAAGGSLSSSGGGISVALDESVDLQLDASTSGGSVRCDIPVTVRGEVSRTRIRGALGSGGAELKLRTSGGSIRIEPL